MYRDLPDTQTLYTHMHTLSQDPVCQLSISCPLAGGLFSSDEYHLHLEPDPSSYPPTLTNVILNGEKSGKGDAEEVIPLSVCECKL